ncbi:stalk domain-containing protein [Tissierella sp.]|uniref:stalk domain-containing protein n=1 Tax=Tissierella sp. TaxID=41274 RepID=UPI002863561C|nr:stalk domain-containing protein [Tissierella sp.]MDR7855555.1 stalk domain-containing protein [Tissierella sp.]
MMKRYKLFKVFVIAFVLVSLVITPKTYAGGETSIDANYLNLEEYRGLGETVLNVKVTGTTQGSAWGTGIYSDDSDIGVAAVHAGILKAGETKSIKITILPGQNSYVGSLKNGIETYDYPAFDGSFKFTDAVQTTEEKIFDAKYLNLEEYRGLGETILNVKVTGTTQGSAWGTGIYSDDSDIGVAAVHAGILKAGETKTLKITILPGQTSYVGTLKNGIESYGYGAFDGSFKFTDAAQTTDTPKPPTPPVKTDEDISSEVFKEGVIMSWKTKGVLGYRLFRSTTENDLGISVTDFYITINSYADVNVEPNTTYYYTVKPVLVEADPIKGIKEELGDAIAKYKIKTGNEVTKSENVKNFIVLQIDNPNMSVNGKIQEIDPGRGTTPIVVSSRSMVPIRAIVEAMGGTVGWDSSTQQITLTANGSTVNMWVGKKSITVNGEKREIDVTPIVQNGRTYVPVRFAAENLNAKVDWINSTKEAVITYEVKKNNNLGDEKIITPADPKTPTQPEVPTEPKTPIVLDDPKYTVPKQPVFYMEDDLKLLDGNLGQVTFRLKRPVSLGELTGFKVYFTNNGKSEVYEFTEDAFAYTEEIGKTTDISITTVNGTVESTPQKLKFTLLERIVGKTMWSERQSDELVGSRCWYGLSWQPVKGASKYKVYVSGSKRNYMNFQNDRDLTGFSEIVVTDTSFSTKLNTGLPADIVNASWGESRYVVVFPMNEDGIIGAFPKYFEITMTGVSSPAHY